MKHKFIKKVLLIMAIFSLNIGIMAITTPPNPTVYYSSSNMTVVPVMATPVNPVVPTVAEIINLTDKNDSFNYTVAANNPRTNFEVNAKAGNDIVNLYSRNTYKDTVRLHGDSGDDILSCLSYWKLVNIWGGDGNDRLLGIGLDINEDGGAGNDTIYAYLDVNGGSVFLSGGEGDDALGIMSWSNGAIPNKITLRGEGGNDLIYLPYIGLLKAAPKLLSSPSMYYGGPGDDTYLMWESNIQANPLTFTNIIDTEGTDTFQLQAYKLSDLERTDSMVSGFYTILFKPTHTRMVSYPKTIEKVKGYDGIKNYTDLPVFQPTGAVIITIDTKVEYINLTEKNDSFNYTVAVNNPKNSFIVYALGGNDIVNIMGRSTFTDYLQIYGGNGDDTLYARSFSTFGNSNWKSIDIHGDDGNDTIIGAGMDIRIDGGAGRDEVRSEVTKGDGIVCLIGGAGDDTVGLGSWSSSVIPRQILLSGGEGNDFIYLPFLGLLKVAPQLLNNPNIYDGGNGDDTYYIWEANIQANPLTFTNIFDSAGTDTLRFGSSYKLSDLERSETMVSGFYTILYKPTHQRMVSYPKVIERVQGLDGIKNYTDLPVYVPYVTPNPVPKQVSMDIVLTEKDDYFTYTATPGIKSLYVNALGGNDSIKIDGKYLEDCGINGGLGNDTMYGMGKNVNIYGYNGNDQVYCYLYVGGGTINLGGGLGNDSVGIMNFTPGAIPKQIFMFGDEGNDFIILPYQDYYKAAPQLLSYPSKYDGGNGDDTYNLSGTNLQSNPLIFTNIVDSSGNDMFYLNGYNLADLERSDSIVPGYNTLLYKPTHQRMVSYPKTIEKVGGLNGYSINYSALPIYNPASNPTYNYVITENVRTPNYK